MVTGSKPQTTPIAMEKYYRTLRTSETGQKFEEIEKKTLEASEHIERLNEKYGFENYYEDLSIYSYGSIRAVVFPEGVEVDMDVWKQEKSISYNAYSPRKGSKAGKAISKEFDAVPKGYRSDINEIVGYEQVFNNVGYTMENSTYFGFIVGAHWSVVIPPDCQEITASQYEQLLKP